MLEILEFIFSSGWTFFGVCLLLPFPVVILAQIFTGIKSIVESCRKPVLIEEIKD